MQIKARTERTIIIDGITDSDIRSRNFKGEEKRHPVTNNIVNGAGRRNFLLNLPEDIAAEFAARGCEVKRRMVTNPNDEPIPYVSINVSYYLKPVDAKMYVNGVETILGENDIGKLDKLDIANLCLELDFGKQKTHKNGDPFVPIFAQGIIAEIVPNYMMEKARAIMAAANSEAAVPII